MKNRTSQLQRLFTDRTERTIAASRVLLAAASLFAIWMDPAEPARNVGETYALHVAYNAYSLMLVFVMWNRPSTGRLPIITHVVDIAVFSVLQLLTLGPSSPLFVYFIFSLFCAALRWDWRGTLGTALAVLVSYLIMAAYISLTIGPSEFELNRFIIRLVYLALAGALLVFLGRHETRLRSEIERLARWPMPGGQDRNADLARVFGHAAQILSAGRAVAVWELEEEPWVYVAAWSSNEFSVTKNAPGHLTPLVPAELTHAMFLCPGPVSATADAAISVDGGFGIRHDMPAHPALMPRLAGNGLASAPFQSTGLAGRIFFSELDNPTTELWTLIEAVARQVGLVLEHLQSTDQLREIAVREQRISVARDLHDGVLQSLTGLRLELQSVATQADSGIGIARDRLLGIERALANEQRELRLFIEGLRPRPVTPEAGALESGLEALRQRVALEWKVPLTIRIPPQAVPLSERLEQAVPLMAHEAVVNALKHAQPTRITVDVSIDDRVLTLVVTDDGNGFPFRGHYDHSQLSRMNLGPASLRERAASLGGTMMLDSTQAGSRVEIAVPLGA